MHRLRLAVATAPFQLPIKQAIEAAGRLGVEGVQLDARTEIKPDEMGETARKQLLHYLDERSLVLGSLALSLQRPLYEREKLDLRMDLVRGAMLLASRLKVRVLVLKAGQIPAKETPERSRLNDILRDIAAFGNHLGVIPTITPSDDSADGLLELVESVTTGPIGIDFDPAGFVVTRRKPEEALRHLHAVVQHIQIRDARSDVDGVGIETPVGQGEVRWDEILALSAEMNYQGWLTIRRTGGQDRSGDCGRAARFLRELGGGGG